MPDLNEIARLEELNRKRTPGPIKFRPVFDMLGHLKNSNLIEGQCMECGGPIRAIQEKYNAGDYDYVIVSRADFDALNEVANACDPSYPDNILAAARRGVEAEAELEKVLAMDAAACRRADTAQAQLAAERDVMAQARRDSIAQCKRIDAILRTSLGEPENTTKLPEELAATLAAKLTSAEAARDAAVLERERLRGLLVDASDKINLCLVPATGELTKAERTLCDASIILRKARTLAQSQE